MTPSPLFTVFRRNVGAVRLAIGLSQGLLLYLLFRAFDTKAWPATNPVVFNALLASVLFTPLVLLQAFGHLARRPLQLWTVCVALLTAGLGIYDGYRNALPAFDPEFNLGQLLACLTAGLFIAQTLILSAAAEGKWIASYPTYFDTAWKHGVQAAAAIAFVAAFWLLMYLGASLFKLINLHFLQTLIEKRWFEFPATAIAVAAAIHVTDVRPALVRGIRTLALTLLSWLLPLLMLIVAGFLASLPFTGLQPLWNTKFATSLLLVVAAALITLINTAYQDGAPEGANVVMRIATKAASVLLAPIVVIAAYALTLRVRQYGWTTDRVIALACIVVAGCYAVGYLAAALRPGVSAKYLEKCNIATALAVLAILFALFTPIADPIRIGVNSQMSRLERGKVSPDKFDFMYLASQSGRYGRAALERLKSGAVQIAGAAEQADRFLKMNPRGKGGPPTPEILMTNISVAGSGSLPESFVNQDWAPTPSNHSARFPDCLRRDSATCLAIVLDLDNDGADEVILLNAVDARSPTIFKREADVWIVAGSLPRRMACGDIRAHLEAEGARALASSWRDVEVAGMRFHVEDERDADRFNCPSGQ